MAEPEGIRGESVSASTRSSSPVPTSSNKMMDPDAAKENDAPPTEKRGGRQRSQRAKTLKKYVPKREFIKARTKSKDAGDEEAGHGEGGKKTDMQTDENFSPNHDDDASKLTASTATAAAANEIPTSKSLDKDSTTMNDEHHTVGAGDDEKPASENTVEAAASAVKALSAILATPESIHAEESSPQKPPKPNSGVLEFAMKKAKQPASSLRRGVPVPDEAVPKPSSPEHRDPDGVCSYLNASMVVPDNSSIAARVNNDSESPLQQDRNAGLDPSTNVDEMSETSKPNSVELNKHVASKDKAATTEKIISVLEMTARPAKLERQPTADSSLESVSSQSFLSTVEGEKQHEDDNGEEEDANLTATPSEDDLDDYEHTQHVLEESSVPDLLEDDDGDSEKQYPSECSAEDPQRSSPSASGRKARRQYQQSYEGTENMPEMRTSGNEILQDLQAFTNDTGSVETSLSKQLLYDTEDQPVASIRRSSGQRNPAALQNAKKICAEARLSMSSSIGSRSPDRDLSYDPRQMGHVASSPQITDGDRPLLLEQSTYSKQNGHVNIFRDLASVSTDDSSAPIARMRYCSKSVGSTDIPAEDGYDSDCALKSYQDVSSFTENETTYERRARVSFAEMHRNTAQVDLSECHGSASSITYTTTATREKQRFDDASSSKASSVPTTSDSRRLERSLNPNIGSIEDKNQRYHRAKVRETETHHSNVSVDSSTYSYTKEETGSVFSAIFGGATKTNYESEDSDEDSYDSSEDESSCSSDDEADEDDRTYLSSLFTEGTPDEGRSVGFDFASKWCDEIIANMPSVPQIEDLLKVATDFGLSEGHSERHKYVEQDPNQEDLHLFENNPKPKSRRGAQGHPNSEEFNSAQGTSFPETGDESADPGYQTALVVRKKKAQARKFDPSEECGVLTLQDIKEIAEMFSAAIQDVDAKAKAVHKKVQPSRLAIKHKPSSNKRDLDRSNDSTEVAWDRVEQTVGDAESVTAGSILSEDAASVKDRIALKLHHFKIKQPHLYKILLAKMAAAESGKNFRLDCEAIIKDIENGTLDGNKVLNANTGFDASKKSGSSKSDENLGQPTEPVPEGETRSEAVRDPRCDGMQPASSWESFGGSPFKESERDAAIPAVAVTEWTDSVPYDKSQMQGSEKACLKKPASTKSSASSKLKEKIELYSKKNPELYRMLLTKVADRKNSSRNDADGSTEADAKQKKAEGESRVIRAVRLLNASLKGRTDKNVATNDSLGSKKKSSSKSRFKDSGDAEEVGSINFSSALSSSGLGDARSEVNCAVDLVDRVAEPALDDEARRCHESTSTNLPTTGKPEAPTTVDQVLTHCAVAKHIPNGSSSQAQNECDDMTVETNCTEQSVETSLHRESTSLGLESHGNQDHGPQKPRKSDFDSLRAAIAQRNWKQYVDRNEGAESDGMDNGKPASVAQTATIVTPAVETTEEINQVSQEGRPEEAMQTVNVASKIDSTAHIEDSSSATYFKPPSAVHVSQSSATTTASGTLRSPESLPSQSKPEPGRPMSKWESFDGSNFKEMLYSFTEDKKATLTVEQKQAALSLQIEESFLDSILPAPPTFSAASQDQWTDFSTASAQWEHFSPLSFDANYTKWGSSRRAPPKPPARASNANNTFSPSSIAEI